MIVVVVSPFHTQVLSLDTSTRHQVAKLRYIHMLTPSIFIMYPTNIMFTFLNSCVSRLHHDRNYFHIFNVTS